MPSPTMIALTAIIFITSHTIQISVMAANTTIPSSSPTSSPSNSPIKLHVPSISPSLRPSSSPTIFAPSVSPTHIATHSPTRLPTRTPTRKPTSTPTLRGQSSPTVRPTTTLHPTLPPSTKAPSQKPTRFPSRFPTTRSPTGSPSHFPTRKPTQRAPTLPPTNTPTRVGEASPTRRPSLKPTSLPSHSPTTNNPSQIPTTSTPSSTPHTSIPSTSPSHAPSWNPAYPNPSRAPVPPSSSPTLFPTIRPSLKPTNMPTPNPTNVPKINVLLIIADDYRPLSSSFQQLAIPPVTPNIDHLLTKSIRFLNAHTQISICGPSRASFLTSLRPDYTNIFSIDRENALQTRIDNSLQYNGKIMMTIPRLFKSHGYVSYGYGKIPHENEDAMMQDPLTWTVPVYTWKSPYFRPPTFTTPYQGMWINNPDVLDSYFPDGVLGNTAAEQLSVLAANPQQPFFLAAGFWKPHLPWSAPLSYFEMQTSVANFTTAHHGGTPNGLSATNFAMARGDGCGEIAPYPGGPSNLAGWDATDAQERAAAQAYYATVTYMDAQVGKLLNALFASPAANNTVIVFMGDHGFHLGDHGLYCKHTNFEQGTRTGLAIMPALRDGTFDANRGQPYVGPVELLDIMPTLADLTGLPKSNPEWEIWQGTSLLPVLHNLNTYVKYAAVSQYWRGQGISKWWGYSIRTTRYRNTLWCPAGQQLSMGGHTCWTEMWDYFTDRYEQQCLAGNTNLVNMFRAPKVAWTGMFRFNSLTGVRPFDWLSDQQNMLSFYDEVALYP